jgi:exonuclease III
MKIRFATWNMAHWSHKKFNKEAWSFFLNDLHCDALLFQESVPCTEILNKEQLVWNMIGGTRPWGTGIYCPTLKINEHIFKHDFFGAVVAAEIEIKPDHSLIVVSLYGLMEKLCNASYSIPNLHRMFSDLTELLESRDTKNRIIIGGDFNASLQIDEIQSNNSHAVFFQRLKEFHLHNCFDDFFDTFIQTHRHSRSSKPWQNDYFFISKKLKPDLTHCEVIENDSVFKFSDHNPVIIELDL